MFPIIVSSYAVTSVMSSRLILSLRHHAAKQDHSNHVKTGGAGFTSKHAGAAASLHHHAGGLGHRSETGYGEKGAVDVGNMQAHIALDNLNSTFHKGDEESQDGHTTTIPGVYVVTETKTVVDDHRRGQ
jgi:hypothetical protein